MNKYLCAFLAVVPLIAIGQTSCEQLKSLKLADTRAGVATRDERQPVADHRALLPMNHQGKSKFFVISKDPMDGNRIGGVNVFGDGPALYDGSPLLSAQRSISWLLGRVLSATLRTHESRKQWRDPVHNGT